MRIVVNGWFWDQMTAGSGQYLAALAAVLPRVQQEHELFLALPDTRSAQPAPEGWRTILTRARFSRFSLNLSKVWFEQVAFPRVCRRLCADVAFVPYWGSPWWRPCPVVVTVHDLIPLLLPLYRGGLLQRLYTQLVGATAKRASAVITDSQASRRDIMQHLRIPGERIHAVHLAANACEGAHDAAESAVRARLNLPAGPFLLYLGGFDARKNVSRTLEAYARLVRRCLHDGIHPPALVIAGRLPAVDSAFAPDPRLQVQALGLTGRVHFIGWVEERAKADLLRLATGVLFVSEYEGFGLPVLEAMACDD